MSDGIPRPTRDSSRPAFPRAWIPWLIQLALLLVVLCVPFGFDHPSSFGLDFDDFLWIAALFLGLASATAVIAIIGRRWALLAADALIVAAGVAAVFLL